MHATVFITTYRDGCSAYALSSSIGSWCIFTIGTGISISATLMIVHDCRKLSLGLAIGGTFCGVVSSVDWEVECNSSADERDSNIGTHTLRPVASFSPFTSGMKMQSASGGECVKAGPTVSTQLRFVMTSTMRLNPLNVALPLYTTYQSSNDEPMHHEAGPWSITTLSTVYSLIQHIEETLDAGE